MITEIDMAMIGITLMIALAALGGFMIGIVFAPKTKQPDERPETR